MSTLKVMISGANGQLGSDIISTFLAQKQLIFSYTHADAGIEESAKWETWISEYKPDVFINTAAFHQVDLCEADPEKAMLINCISPAQIASICFKHKVRFVNISTDYVFDGNKNEPYLESDQTKPLNVYGLSKQKGEEAILANNADAIIVRVSAIYGVNPCRAKNGLNFVQLMLKKARENADLKVVSNEIVSPTSTQSIADKLVELLETTVKGIVHISSVGQCSWYEFAQAIFELSGTPAKLSEANSSDFPAKTPRPAYSVLANQKLKELHLKPMPHWKESLKVYLSKL
ncbi:MAG: dTDP-4-dehydrorhamnose reductase [Bacteroidia bacterium]|nr:dTDP-4-dehydrorhamnose reductase [Bacteroidia bacterium]